ncbi:hypothetical protein A1O1_09281 [Capronia coronata CBS 617.96]|uniref:SnoaL-like domain-containing protein n=1 Tax=Capronia coronata CBS 617.96 TaxID=1182541 RepID=W9Y935_9EURO|nr:uncharacterized protein A1O1_09281 [Capronia coronata CBS 617.96]EXJ78879.1 hypothetical protein A1O1_09281 [Capronia coronata CBS 617.96]
MDLRQLYTDYIAQINAGCGSGALAKYVNNGIVHNDSSPLSVDDYAQIILDSQASFPGLLFEVDMLVTDDANGAKGGGSIAARIKLSYDRSVAASNPSPETTSQQSTKETFYEHVFYSLEGGKISRVWSILDGAGQRWREELEARKGQ